MHMFSNEEPVTTSLWHLYAKLSAILWKPFSRGLKYCGSKCSASQEHHPVKQTDEVWGSRHTSSGCRAHWVSIFSLPPHSLGSSMIWEKPDLQKINKNSFCFCCKTDFSFHWNSTNTADPSMSQAAQDAALDFVSVWQPWVIWWQGMQLGMRCMKERSAALCVVLKAGLYAERWAGCWSLQLLCFAFQ